MPATSLTEFTPAAFEPEPMAPPVTKLGFVGQGDVMKKFGPALVAIGRRVDGVVVCSLEAESRLTGFAHEYYQVSADNLLPWHTLAARGYLSAVTAWVIATPSAFHVHYVPQLAHWSRVGIEKPLARSYGEAQRLLPFVRAGAGVYPIDHKLFNAPALAFIDGCRRDPAPLQTVRHIEGTFFEVTGVDPARAIDDAIADCQWHLFVPVIAAYKKLGVRFTVAIDETQTAYHLPSADRLIPRAGVSSASRLRGRLCWGDTTATFDFRQAKAAAKSEKGIRFFNSCGEPVAAIDLNESGWHAHARVLDALMQPAVDMRHTLADALEVSRLVDVARAKAGPETSYLPADLPVFLREA